MVLTGVLSVLAPLADLARDTSHLLLAPANLSAVAVARTIAEVTDIPVAIRRPECK